MAKTLGDVLASYEYGIRTSLVGAAWEAKADTMIENFRSFMEYMWPKQQATKTILDTLNVPLALYAQYLNFARQIARAIYSQQYAGLLLKAKVNDYKGQWTLRGLVPATMENISLNAFGLPLV